MKKQLRCFTSYVMSVLLVFSLMILPTVTALGNETGTVESSNTHEHTIPVPIVETVSHAALEVQAFSVSSTEQRVLELVNIERANNGLNPLQWCAHLGAAARLHSKDMAAHNNISHTGSDGSTPWERFARIGIRYTGMAENVAVGQTTPETVITSWMNSEGHRNNILNPNYTHIGVGLAQTDSGWRFFWTQKFGGGTRTVITPLPVSCDCVHCAKCNCGAVHTGKFDDGVVNGESITGAPWRLYECGMLVVDEGLIELDGGYRWTSSSPWRTYSFNIGQIVFTGTITAGESLNGLFMDLSGVTAIEGLSNFDTENVTDMRNMFKNVSSLTSLDVSAWDTRNVINMSVMFADMDSLTSLDVSDWDTSNVTNMRAMFSGMNSLTSLDVSKWDTSNVTDMRAMFYAMYSLTNLDVSKWDTSSVEDMGLMFLGACNLTSLDLSKWNTGNVMNMESMFSDASSLTSLDLSGWDTGNVTDAPYMFRDTLSLNSLALSDKFHFSATDFFSILPPVPKNEQFTGYWQNVGTGTPENPQGNHVFTSDELVEFYRTPGFADTWVWQKTLHAQQTLLGDLNSDERITSADATLLARYLIQHPVTVNIVAADIDRDGEITSADLTHLSQALVGIRTLP